MPILGTFFCNFLSFFSKIFEIFEIFEIFAWNACHYMYEKPIK